MNNEKNRFISSMISIIIPVYNCSQYLEDCVKSIDDQTYKNIEIIIIDDGSTNDTSNIITRTVSKYKNVTAYYQNNSGAGVARNLGLSYAKGEYIAFLDADDFYYDKNAIEKMIKVCKKTNLPICASYRVEYINKNYFHSDMYKSYKIDDDYITLDFANTQYDFFFQSYIYNHEFLIDNDISFPSYRRFEDPVFLVKALDASKKFALVDTNLHCYRKGHQNRDNNTQYIVDNLMGIKEVLLIAQEKYHLLYEENICRIDKMFRYDIEKMVNDDVHSILAEINNIYRKKSDTDLQIFIDFLKLYDEVN